MNILEAKYLNGSFHALRLPSKSNLYRHLSIYREHNREQTNQRGYHHQEPKDGYYLYYLQQPPLIISTAFVCLHPYSTDDIIHSQYPENKNLAWPGGWMASSELIQLKEKKTCHRERRTFVVKIKAFTFISEKLLLNPFGFGLTSSTLSAAQSRRVFSVEGDLTTRASSSEEARTATGLFLLKKDFSLCEFWKLDAVVNF